MKLTARENKTPRDILLNILLAFASLCVNGFGVYLCIKAGIGVGPWDVFNLGVANTFGILYGNASITVSFIILAIDILMREPIGIAMFIDAVTVGKAVDFFNHIDPVRTPATLPGSIALMLASLVVLNISLIFYMLSALGCGPRDTLLVGLKRRAGRIPVGAVNVLLYAGVTLVGWLLGGPVGVGTLIIVFVNGPVLQALLYLFRLDITGIRHQHLLASLKILFPRRR